MLCHAHAHFAEQLLGVHISETVVANSMKQSCCRGHSTPRALQVFKLLNVMVTPFQAMKLTGERFFECHAEKFDFSPIRTILLQSSACTKESTFQSRPCSEKH